MIRFKFYFFRNYWWLLTLLFICVCAGIVRLQTGFDFKLLATLLGTFLTVLYFLQKQRLEEMKLFREIFTECNDRYDKMNEMLNAIVADPESQSLQPEERRLLNDYFNLCGEEYLYYSQGYIYPAVWKAWYKGMSFFITNPRIALVWEKEKKSESYYGLTFQIGEIS